MDDYQTEEPVKQFDVIVVGSGTGLVAALKAQLSGADVLVIEKSKFVGGTTAVSGGGMWLPNSAPVIKQSGRTPQPELKQYIRRVAGDHVPQELIEKFLDTAPTIVEFFEQETRLNCQLSGYHDYHPEFDGSDMENGRMVEPEYLDTGPLKDILDDVRISPHHSEMLTMKDTLQQSGGMAKQTKDSRPRSEPAKLARGRALIAALYEACLEAGVEVKTDTAAVDLIHNNNTVCGLVTDTGQAKIEFHSEAVIIAAGGMEWDSEMCKNFLRGPFYNPASPPHNEGKGIKMGMSVGAKLGNMNELWGYPTAHVNGEEWEDGTPLYRTFRERGLPHIIMVNEFGERFCNEAGNYNDLIKSFHEFDPGIYGYRNVPAYAIFDSQFRKKYPILTLSPSDKDPEWLTRAATVGELATETGINSSQLQHTVEKFNGFVKRGRDPEYNRGESEFDRKIGDPQQDPPNFGSIKEEPFYAIEIYPGGFGTKGGLVTTPKAEVLSANDGKIPGLYASGNSTAHVMGMGYTGGGATLGPNVVFAYLAGNNAAQYNRQGN